MQQAALALLLLILPAGMAMAHKVNVFAVVENGYVTGEGYFAGGAKAQEVPVELVDANGKVVAAGATTPDGTFRIPLPQSVSAPLKVVLKAGEGHQNDYTLTAADLGASPAGSTLPPPTPGALPIPGVHQAPPKADVQQGQAAGVQTGGLDEARLTALVEAATAKAVEEKLAPLKLELVKMAEQAQSNRLRDIIGGIGWIVGLIGIAAWFKRPRQ